MERPDALLFDLDGTIVDSRLPYTRSLNEALAAVGLPTHAPAELEQYLGPPMHETLVAHLGVPPELADRVTLLYRERYARLGLAETVVYDGVRELLEALHGHVALALASSKVQTLADALLEHLGLRQLFDAVVGADPEAVNEPKSATIAAAIVALGGASANGASPGDAEGVRSPIMIGDRRFDVEGARQHGIATIGVLWGAGSEAELREAGARWLVSRPDQIPGLLGL